MAVKGASTGVASGKGLTDAAPVARNGMSERTWSVTPLGQSGFRLAMGGRVLYTDPYLTERVAEVEGPGLRRLRPAPMRPEDVRDADLVLVSHEHLDHFDPTTLRPLLAASPAARLLAPASVCRSASEWLPPERHLIAREGWLDLGGGLRVHAVPAAHPTIERDGEGLLTRVGFVLEESGRRLYFAGDTSPHEDIVAAVRRLGGVHVAMIPVNERNHYKDRMGILGNMSAREAFQLAEEIGAATLVPIHWDLFEPNRVFPEEVELLHKRLAPPFDLAFDPKVL